MGFFYEARQFIMKPICRFHCKITNFSVILHPLFFVNDAIVEPIISETFFLSAGETNAEKEMALTVLVSKFIDIATLHANSLHIGNPDMADKKAGWVLARLDISMKSLPLVNESYTISTWIEGFNRHFSTRCFEVTAADGTVHGQARSVWVVIDTFTHSNIGISHFSLPDELILGKSVNVPDRSRHIPKICQDVTDHEEKNCLRATVPPLEHTFLYCDLDYYRHVNTVRYVALLLNQFSLDFHDHHRIKGLELSFLHEAVYGKQNLLYRSDDTHNLSSAFSLNRKEDDTQLFFAKVFFENRSN